MRSRLTNSVVFWVSFAIFGLAGAIWSVSTPPEASPDEPFHTIRAAAIVRGDIGGRTVEIPSPGPPLPNTIQYPVTVPESYADLTDAPTCFAFQPDVSADCQPALGTSTADATETTSFGSYPALYYALVGWPSLVATADPGIYWMRVLSVLAGAALFASGVVAARETDRSGLVFAGVALAVTPMALFMIGVVNASGLEIAAAFATWTGALALVRASDDSIAPSILVRAALPAIVLAWSRPDGPITLAVIVVIVGIFAADRQSAVRLARDARAVVAAGITALAVAGAACWIVFLRSFDSLLGVPQPGLTRIDAAEESIGKLPLRLEEMVGRFGWLDVPLPRAVTVTWGLAVLALLLAGLRFGRGRQRVALALAVVAVLAIPVAAEAYGAPKYGFIWQGRYTLPTAVGLPVLAALAVARRPTLARRLVPFVVLISAVIAACAHLIAHVAAMRRYITGVDAPLLQYLTVSGWRPPLLPPWALLVFCVTVTVGWAAWLVIVATTATQASEQGRPAATLGQLCSPASRSSSSTIGPPSTR